MDHNNQKYKIVRASRENISALSQLFLETKGINVPVDYLKSKFNTAYTGKTYFAHFAMTEDNQPAAFFCLFPCFVLHNGSVILAGQSADIITHVSHQRKGLFSSLGKATEALAQSEGMKILFAFPNENSFPGFVRSLNWHHSSNFMIYRFKSNGIPFYRLLSKFRMNWIYTQFANLIKNKFKCDSDQFQGSIPRNLISSGYRNKDYYSYKKYNDSFFVHYRGLKFWCKIDVQLWIGDISIDDNLSIDNVVTILKKYTALLGLDEFVFEVSEGSFWDNLLRTIAVSTQGVPIVYKNLEDLDESVSLEFTGGDIDVF